MKKICLLMALTVLLASCKSQNMLIQSTEDSNRYSSSRSKWSYSSSIDCTISKEYLPETWENSTQGIPDDKNDIMHGENQLRNIQEVYDEISVVGQYPMPLITNTMPLDDIMSIVNEGVIYAEMWNAGISTIRSISSAHPSNMYERTGLPISFLRVTKDGCYYSVNKLIGGGYVYLFFERARNYDDFMYKTDDLTDVRITGCVYVEKTLSKNVFDSITVGDPIENVIEVDNAASFAKYISEYAFLYNAEKKDYLYSVHLLADGLITFLYEYKDDAMVVSDIIFSSDFIFTTPYDGLGYPKYYGILPQDYPPEA